MPLPLPSLEIEGFRTFDHLQLPRLGRANLLVGRNNSGKSSVLEAIRIYATRAEPSVLLDILQSREELILSSDDVLNVQRLTSALQHLFHGRGPDDFGLIVAIGPLNDESERLRIATDTIDQMHEGLFIESVPSLLIRFGGVQRPVAFGTIARSRAAKFVEDAIRYSFVPPNGISPSRITALWDEVTLTDLEDQVLHALRIIAPEVRRLTAVGDDSSQGRRIMVASTGDRRTPVPLKSMGDGMNRFLGIALSLVSARDGILLIDEIENGIHFSVQERLWDLIFREARRLDVQVFATTHSWDCIEAFQRAARRDEGEEAALIRLDHRDGRIWPTTFSEHELSIVAREHLEVR